MTLLAFFSYRITQSGLWLERYPLVPLANLHAMPRASKKNRGRTYRRARQQQLEVEEHITESEMDEPADNEVAEDFAQQLADAHLELESQQKSHRVVVEELEPGSAGIKVEE